MPRDIAARHTEQSMEARIMGLPDQEPADQHDQHQHDQHQHDQQSILGSAERAALS
jgi:hypothetical protein